MPTDMPADRTYTIADLARLVGVNVRTIRYYLGQGLIPAPGASGPGAHYGEGHLDRLRLIKRLQQQHLPLAEIRMQLAAMGDLEVAEVLGAPAPNAARPETSALEYVRRVLGTPSNPSGPARLSIAGSPMAYPVAAPAAPAAHAAPAARALLRRAASLVVPVAMPRMKDAAAPAPSKASPATPTAASSAAEPPTIERSQWERVSLGPNLELHIRRPLGRLEQRRVERLLTIARQVLKEGQP
jgi:DNA-binding transcriptional MerR regulator